MPYAAPRRPRGPSVRPAGTPALWTFLAINVLVYLLWHSAGTSRAGADLMAAHFLVSTESVFSGRFWTLLTTTVSHVSPSHLLFNMLALWVFGSDVHRVIGGKRFTMLYIVGGLIASIGHVVFSLLMGTSTPALGASGSVMAIAVVFGALFPKRTLMINFLIPIPAALAVGLYILLDVFGLFTTGSGVAHAAHLGGALFGFLYWFFAVRRKVRRAPQRRW